MNPDLLLTIALKLGLAWLGSWIRGVAEGKQGTRLQAWYLALQGLKTWTGLILGAATAVMVYLTEPVLLDWVTGTLAALLLSAGLLDKAWRTPPVKVTESKAYRYAREHALDVRASVRRGRHFTGALFRRLDGQHDLDHIICSAFMTAALRASG